MKKWMALLLAMLLLFGLTACGSKTEEERTEYTIAMVCSSSINDGGWGESCYHSMVEAADSLGWKTDYKDSVPDSESYDAIKDFCLQGVTMIYATGEQYNDVVLQLAEEYPDVAFALLNGFARTSMLATNCNVVAVMPSPEQIGRMAGTLAALQTKTGVLAFIGGAELESSRVKYKAFCDAAGFVAAEEGKTVTVLDSVYAGSFDDAGKGESLASAMMEQGADVFFGDASAVDSGTRTAIDSHNEAAGKVEVFDIGQPADLLGQNECVIGSVVTDNTAMLKNVMRSFELGAFGGSTQYGSIQNAVLNYGGWSDLVSEDNQAKLADYYQQMLNMTFMNEDY
ncbi:MAG: BMP family ABC transporter substrate-binding protein [Oscillospiraceae bacterium]|nr:BMP family ABC transporter substrate-binding protein [Oscillospiraceae bacterium]